MIERIPPRKARPSEAALAAGSELYPLFRKHVPLVGPLTAKAIDAISSATHLKERRIRELARRFRLNPVAESLASRPKGPKPGSRRAPQAVLDAIDALIEELYLKMVAPSGGEAARQIRGLLIADNGDFRTATGPDQHGLEGAQCP